MTENFRVENFRFHEDAKAQRLIDILPTCDKEGQINICYYREGTSWHKHKFQTDQDICIKGAFQVGLAHSPDFDFPNGYGFGSCPSPIEITRDNPNDGELNRYEVCDYKISWVFLSEKTPQTLIIPPGIWHAVKPLEENSIILYYMTQKYNPDDIEEVPIGHFGEEW